MRNRLTMFVAFVLSLSLLFGGDAFAGRRVKVYGQDQATGSKSGKKPGGKGKEKPFSTMTKDKVKIEGLFTFYQDTLDNSMLMEIKKDQLGPVYLMGQTLSASEGAYFDNGSMGGNFPFYLKRVGKNIMLMEKNIRFRADSTSTLSRALERGFSDHLFATMKVKSKPDDSGTILVDPSSIFIQDIYGVGHALGKQGIRFDKSNSYFKLVKSFPLNTEVDVVLHFKTSKPISSISMQSGNSLFHTYHFSLSTLPETDFTPRIADDRVGHFLTLYQDYTDLRSATPYVRYINRWNLKKKNPDARLSEPVEPIVYWVENTVPEEYRDAVAEGIEYWNKAFEKIGFRNAIVAKQMSDTATWDPADVRYNTVRWILNPGASYAVGPSHANPYTGQLYDADIRVCVDFIRYMFINAENFVAPMSADGHIMTEETTKYPDSWKNNPMFCNYGEELAHEAAFGLTYLSTLGDFADLDSLSREYVHAYIVELVAHEIGHTIGLRHNFKASTIYTLDQINDRDFTLKNGTIGSIMDYAPPNIAGPGKTQGEFFCSEPGPYDDWVIEYAYTDFGEMTGEEVDAKLKAIADRSPEHGLIYATDEDAFGSSPRSVDPYCNLFDLGSDPIAYCKHKLTLTKELWNNAIQKFEKPGENYKKIRQVFGYGWRSYTESARFGAKFIGGIHHSRHHIGDKDGEIPFRPVSAAKQREAMKFLSDNIFAADAFSFPENLLNKLQPERFPDFSWSVYAMNQVDYPIYSQVLYVQNQALSRLYSRYILNRLVNNQNLYAAGEDRYTITDMFRDTRRAIWTEITGTENVNTYRRNLQMSHLGRLISIYLGSSIIYNYDARAMAGNDLETIENAINKIVGSSNLDEITSAHYKEVVRQITAAKGADREFLGLGF